MELQADARDARIDEFYVRRRGEEIGRHALDEVMELLRRQGFVRAFAETERHNYDVRRFYERSVSILRRPVGLDESKALIAARLEELRDLTIFLFGPEPGRRAEHSEPVDRERGGPHHEPPLEPP